MPADELVERVVLLGMDGAYDESGRLDEALGLPRGADFRKIAKLA